LSVVAKERNRLCSRDTFMSMKVNGLQSDLNKAQKHLVEHKVKLKTAEKHVAQLVGAIKILSSKSVTVETDYDHLLSYIKQNGLDK